MSKWELTVVENAGEIPAARVKDEISVETKPLLTDIKVQLMLMPKSLVYTVGWRALVWQDKETGRFKDITDEEYEEYNRTGSVYTASSTGTDSGEVKPSDGGEGNTQE